VELKWGVCDVGKKKRAHSLTNTTPAIRIKLHLGPNAGSKTIKTTEIEKVEL